ASSALPLAVGDPLQVLAEKDLVRELTACVGNRRWIPLAERCRPFRPRPSVLALVERTEQCVIVNPPALRVHVVAECVSARGVAFPLLISKPLECLRQCLVLQRADNRVVHMRRLTDAGEPSAIFRTECLFA